MIVYDTCLFQLERMTYGSIEFFFSPLTIVVSLYLIWVLYLGSAVFSAVGIIILYIPINSVLMKKYATMQVRLLLPYLIGRNRQIVNTIVHGFYELSKKIDINFSGSI